MEIKVSSPHMVVSEVDHPVVFVFFIVEIKTLAKTTTLIDREIIPIMKLAIRNHPHFESWKH